jgi:hypothetical protein
MNKLVIALTVLQLAACKEKIPVTPRLNAWQPVAAKKDTLKKAFSSMTVEELKNYLPSVKDFEKKEAASGETAHIGKSRNKYFSYARQLYTKNNTEYYLEITDYKDDASTLDGLLHMYGFDTVINNNVQRTERENIQGENIKSLSTIYKNQPEAKLIVAVNHRFLISCGSIGDTSLAPLKKLAASIKLDKLAKL